MSKFFTSIYSRNLLDYNDAKKKFNKFIKDIYTTKLLQNEIMHIQCQSNYITQDVNHILIYENIEEDLKNFQKKFNLPIKSIVNINKVINPYKKIDLYDEYSKELVYNNNKEIIDKYYSKI